MPAIFIGLVVVIALISAYTGFGVVGSMAIGLLGIGVIFAIILAIGVWLDDVKQKEQWALDPSDSKKAGSIAQGYAIRAKVDSGEWEAYRQQGEETYRYYRRKGLSNWEAIAAVERAYADLYDRAERKAIASMTRPSTKRRRH